MNHTLYLFLIFSLFLSCSNQSKKEELAYKINENERLLLKIDYTAKTSSIYWIMAGNQDNKNYFGLVEFSGEYSSINDKSLYLSDNIEFVSIKTNDSEESKVPIDQSPESKFDSQSKELTFYGKTFEPLTNELTPIYLDLVNSFPTWDGQKIEFSE